MADPSFGMRRLTAWYGAHEGSENGLFGGAEGDRPI
jgi:hypothetical protein